MNLAVGEYVSGKDLNKCILCKNKKWDITQIKALDCQSK
jgi:hypothetical protein